MRRLLGIAPTRIALPLAAQQPPKPGLCQNHRHRRPASLDPALEPQVTITKRGEDKVEEYRVNGKLYAMKVTPPHGVAYFLIDEAGNGVMSRRDSFDTGLRVPQG